MTFQFLYYFAVGFRLDYVKADGDLSNYYPDFLVKKSESEIYVVETKGRVDEDVPLKMKRLRQWCEEASEAQGKIVYDFVYVDEENFRQHVRPGSGFADLTSAFREYKNPGVAGL